MANASTVVGTPITTAVATDPDLCRVSGYLKNAQGTPLAGWGFVLRYCYAPLTMGTDTVLLQERLVLKTYAAGYVEFDLVRTSSLTLELPNLVTDVFAELKVPDAASVDLVAFLFPYVVTAEFDDASAIGVSVGEKFSVVVNGVLSNGEEVVLGGTDVELSSSNELVADVYGEGPFMYEALAAGTTVLSITSATQPVLHKDRDEEALSFLGLPAITLGPATITVTVS
jgi:hypothetical protein